LKAGPASQAPGARVWEASASYPLNRECALYDSANSNAPLTNPTNARPLPGGAGENGNFTPMCSPKEGGKMFCVKTIDQPDRGGRVRQTWRGRYCRVIPFRRMLPLYCGGIGLSFSETRLTAPIPHGRGVLESNACLRSNHAVSRRSANRSVPNATKSRLLAEKKRNPNPFTLSPKPRTSPQERQSERTQR
jgi:hypothetical protein